MEELINSFESEVIRNIFKKLNEEEIFVILRLNKQLLDKMQKIDKAIDFINEWEKYAKEKRPLEVSMLDLLYIKEILGDKENE